MLDEQRLTALVADLADRDAPRSEADLQSGIKTLLLVGGLNLEDPRIRLETPAPGRRRIDVEVGSTVIECKKDLRSPSTRAEAVAQLAGYVRDRTRALGRRYAGVLTDGHEWHLFHLGQSDDQLSEISTIEVRRDAPDVDSLLVWLEGILSTAERASQRYKSSESSGRGYSPGHQGATSRTTTPYSSSTPTLYLRPRRLRTRSWGSTSEPESSQLRS